MCKSIPMHTITPPILTDCYVFIENLNIPDKICYKKIDQMEYTKKKEQTMNNQKQLEEKNEDPTEQVLEAEEKLLCRLTPELQSKILNC